VSHRSYDHATKLADELHGTAIRFPGVWQAMERVDMVISSTGCPHTIIRREQMEPVMAARNGRRLFLVDIAVPRDIDPGVGEIPGCTVANVDDLREAASLNLRQRQEALAAADRIIMEELEQFRQRQESLQMVPTIISLRERAEQIRRHELARTRELFGEMTPAQEEALDALTQGLINKILHTPCTELKQAAARPDRSEFLGIFRTVFQLEEEASLRPTLLN
jgi:glutamyl-tRNA reductase